MIGMIWHLLTSFVFSIQHVDLLIGNADGRGGPKAKSPASAGWQGF
ncbi:hypothetical protein [Hyphomonas beringensis]|nr:hypothetical protein [Hyphomonas beringensis]